MAITKTQNKINKNVKIKKYFNNISQIYQEKQILNLSQQNTQKIDITTQVDKKYLLNIIGMQNTFINTHTISIVKK